MAETTDSAGSRRLPVPPDDAPFLPEEDDDLWKEDVDSDGLYDKDAERLWEDDPDRIADMDIEGPPRGVAAASGRPATIAQGS
jgi:hypothetical protein